MDGPKCPSGPSGGDWGGPGSSSTWCSVDKARLAKLKQLLRREPRGKQRWVVGVVFQEISQPHPIANVLRLDRASAPFVSLPFTSTVVSKIIIRETHRAALYEDGVFQGVLEAGAYPATNP